MGDGPPGFSPGFTCLDLLGDRSSENEAFKYGTVTLYRAAFQRLLLASFLHIDRPTTPPAEADGLGFFPFARRY